MLADGKLWAALARLKRYQGPLRAPCGTRTVALSLAACADAGFAGATLAQAKAVLEPTHWHPPADRRVLGARHRREEAVRGETEDDDATAAALACGALVGHRVLSGQFRNQAGQCHAHRTRGTRTSLNVIRRKSP